MDYTWTIKYNRITSQTWRKETMVETNAVNIDSNDQNELPSRKLLKKRAALYLSFEFGFILIFWLLAFFLPEPANKNAYGLLIALFSLFPFLSNFLTRLITADKSSWLMKLNFRKGWKTYLMAAFLPGSLIFLGAVLYFLIFPNQMDLSAERLVQTYGRFGFPTDLPHTLNSMIRIGLIGVIISPFILPIGFAGLGEEIGWRAYLLPIFLKLMNRQKAVLLNGFLWGLGHAALIYFGFNYGLDYWGAPYTGIAMMVLICVVIGVWLSYVTIKADSVIPAAIMHGAFNVIGEFPALVAIGFNPLLGPNPTGIIGMSGLIVGAVILFRRLSKHADPL